MRKKVLAASMIMIIAAPLPAQAQRKAPSPSAGTVQTVEPQGKVVFRLADPRIGAPGDVVASTRHRGILWTYDSRPGQAQIFAVDAHGRTVAAYTLAGLPGNRWNSIALAASSSGRSSLVLGDLEDQGGRRSSITVHQFPEPEQLTGGRLTVKTFRLRYPDSPQNADVLIATPSDGRRYVVTRSPLGSKVYALPSELVSGRSNRMTLVKSLDFAVRDAGFAPDGRVVLRDAGSARVLSGISGDLTQMIKLPKTKSEAFGLSTSGRLMLIGGSGPRARFYGFAIPEATAPASGSVPAKDVPAAPVEYPRPAALPGGLLGTGSLIALFGLVIFGFLIHRRGRRDPGT